MDLIKTYSFKVRHYDYFGGDKTSECKFNSLEEALAKMRDSKSHDFNYSDAFRETSSISMKFISPKPRLNQRRHARSEWEWKKIQEETFKHEHCGFDAETIEYIKSFVIDDDDIII